MKNRFNISLSSKLNFSLTKKRLSLIGKGSSVSSLYFKVFPVLLAFAFSPFFFFDLQEEPIEAFSVSHEEYWANKTYSDVNLKRKSLLADGESFTSFDQIFYIVLTENGEPFSGIENIYSKKTELLESSNIYEDGLPVNQKTFDPDGTEFSSLDYFYNPQKTKRISTRYYQYGILSLETIFSSPSHNGAMVQKFWNDMGDLKMLAILDKRDANITYGEVISYDENGIVTFHERYEGLELVEKIK